MSVIAGAMKVEKANVLNAKYFTREKRKQKLIIRIKEIQTFRLTPSSF